MFTNFSIFSNWTNRVPSDKLSIFTHLCHERHNATLAQTGHNFYALKSAERWSWNTKNCPIPSNIKFIENVHYGQDLMFDCIISQTLGQLQEDIKVAQAFGLPIILVQHCLRSAMGNKFQKKYWEQVGATCGANYTVFITKDQATNWYPECWPNPTVIYHGIDSSVFGGWQPKSDNKYLLNVSNDYLGRSIVMGFDTLTNVCQGIKVRCVGDTLYPQGHPQQGQRFSEAAPSLEALAQEYRNASCYFNTTRLSSISTSFLEALVSGLPCVTVDTFSIKEFFEHENHCLIFNESDHDKMRAAIKDILDFPAKYVEMGLRARQKVMEVFNINNHVNLWNNLLYKAVDEKVNPKYN